MNFLEMNADKLLLALLIVFFGSLGINHPFAAKECDTLVGGLGVLLVQKFSQRSTTNVV